MFPGEPHAAHDFDAQADWAERAARDRGVTAFACASDLVGYHLSRRLIDRGLMPGRDVSVTGYDAEEPILGCPPLTTARTPFEEMGVVAFARLTERVARPSLPPRRTMLDCQLVVGQSTGPAEPTAERSTP